MLKFVIKLKRISFHAKARHVGMSNETFSEKRDQCSCTTPIIINFAHAAYGKKYFKKANAGICKK